MIKVLSIAVVVAMIFLFAQVYMTTEAKKETAIYKAKCDSLQKANDSLHWELFPIQIELNRHQIAYQIFLKRNKKAAEEYGTIISEETE